MNASVQVAEETQSQPARLEELYVRHTPTALRLAYLLTGQGETAEDLVHDAFVRLAGRFQHLRNPEVFASYLRKTIVNLHLSRLRRLRLERAYLTREGEAEPTHSSMPDVAGREDTWTALKRLPERQRTAVVLRYYEDLSERESADILRCSTSAVKSLLTRAMATLREQNRGEEQ